MSERWNKKAESAKKLEERLKREGLYVEAEIIRSLRIAGASSNATCKVLHRDNMKLRKQLGLPSFLDEREISA